MQNPTLKTLALALVAVSLSTSSLAQEPKKAAPPAPPKAAPKAPEGGATGAPGAAPAPLSNKDAGGKEI